MHVGATAHTRFQRAAPRRRASAWPGEWSSTAAIKCPSSAVAEDAGVHLKAYENQCAAEEGRHTTATTRRGPTLLALTLGTFAIGTGEFGSNGIIQLFADDLAVSIPTATTAVTA